MAHVGKSGASPQIEQLPPAPRAPHQNLRIQPRSAPAGQGREHIELVPLASIDGQAGVRPDKQGRLVNLAHYAAVTMRLTRERYVPMRGSRGPRLERKEEDDEQAAFLEAVGESLEFLGNGGDKQRRDQLDKHLERYFDPVQRLKILVESLQQAESGDLPEHRKAGVSRSLNAMITILMKKHPHEIRAVLQETEGDPMSEELQSSVRLRLLIGAKDLGKFDTPLSPLTVLKALIKNFGSRCVLAMSSLRTRMMAGL